MKVPSAGDSAKRTLEGVTRFIEKRLHLKVNEGKSGAHYITHGVKFLGYGFVYRPKGRISLTVHQTKRDQRKDDLKEVLARNRKQSLGSSN